MVIELGFSLGKPALTRQRLRSDGHLGIDHGGECASE
jgi:hypothetical protein